MSIDANYAIWGGAFVVFCTLLACTWTFRGIKEYKKVLPISTPGMELPDAFQQQHDFHHQALVYLMTQKTDQALAALSRTIEQERQKLGVVVGNPSTESKEQAAKVSGLASLNDDRLPGFSYENIIPLSEDGMDIPAIAYQLQISEEEVSFFLRFNS